MAKKLFSPKMAIMKISASFPPRDGRPCIQVSKKASQTCKKCEACLSPLALNTLVLQHCHHHTQKCCWHLHVWAITVTVEK